MSDTQESKIIRPNNMPNLREAREREQWLEGKATRREVFQELSAAVQDSQQQFFLELQKMVENQKKIENIIGQFLTMTRTNGLQIDTLIRTFDDRTPGFRTIYNNSFGKTVEMVQFIDTINNGEYAKLEMRDKIDRVRQWNGDPDHVQIQSHHFGLDLFINSNPGHFTDDEVRDLSEEFYMDIQPQQFTTEVTQGETVHVGTEEEVIQQEA